MLRETRKLSASVLERYFTVLPPIVSVLDGQNEAVGMGVGCFVYFATASSVKVNAREWTSPVLVMSSRMVNVSRP